ncbi:MAG: hypothetical protein MH825_08450 [Cyanobacteria bacterium]|nr:hypothetical protein [Cyanobacteriota bacterium]
MNTVERLIVMAEDELTEYSTEARKIEKLRRKISLAVPIAEQRAARETLTEELAAASPLESMVERQRQAVALPFWGIAGLGLLLGVSLNQPGDFVFTLAGVAAAWTVQKWGWRLQAKRLMLHTLEEIERSVTTK